jgi:hypothetical protein
MAEDQKARYRQDGWTEEAITQFEANNVYNPIENAVIAYELSVAMLAACARIHGAEFVHDVRSELTERSVKAAQSPDVEDRVEAKILSAFLAESDWTALIARPSSAGEQR